MFVVLSCSALWRSCHTIREHATDEGLMRGQGELIVGQYPDDDLARQSGELAPSCIQSILMKASTLCSGVPIYPCAQGDAWSVKYEARRGAGSYMGGTTREVIAQVVGSSHVMFKAVKLVLRRINELPGENTSSTSCGTDC